METNLFCSQCGCEILTEDDVGRVETKTHLRPALVGVKPTHDYDYEYDYYTEIVETEIICSSCVAENEAAMEASLTEADFLFDHIHADLSAEASAKADV